MASLLVTLLAATLLLAALVASELALLVALLALRGVLAATRSALLLVTLLPLLATSALVLLTHGYLEPRRDACEYKVDSVPRVPEEATAPPAKVTHSVSVVGPRYS